MIWVFGVLRSIRSALVGAAIIFVLVGGAFTAGRWTGYKAGKLDQIARQNEIDDADAENIKERVRDALDEIGADVGSDDIDRILRRLAGEGSVVD